MSILKKLLSFLLIVCVFAVLIGSMFTVVFFNEFNTMLSVDEVSENVYIADVEGSYYLSVLDDEETGGARTLNNLADFISITVTKGLPTFFPINTKYKEVTNVMGVTNDSVVATMNGTKNPIMIVKTNPFEEDRYASISTVDLAFLGMTDGDKLNFTSNLLAMAAVYLPMNGMNETGLSASVVLTSNTEPTATSESSLIDLTETIMLRFILDYASTAAEAKQLIQSYDVYSSGSNSFEFVIVDSEGNCLNYKSDNTYTETKNTVSSLNDIIVNENFLCGVSYNHVDLIAEYYLTSTTDKPYTVKFNK